MTKNFLLVFLPEISMVTRGVAEPES